MPLLYSAEDDEQEGLFKAYTEAATMVATLAAMLPKASIEHLRYYPGTVLFEYFEDGRVKSVYLQPNEEKSP